MCVFVPAGPSKELAVPGPPSTAWLPACPDSRLQTYGITPPAWQVDDSDVGALIVAAWTLSSAIATALAFVILLGSTGS